MTGDSQAKVFLTKNGKGKDIGSMVSGEGIIIGAQFRVRDFLMPFSWRKNPIGLGLEFRLDDGVCADMFFDEPRLINGILSVPGRTDGSLYADLVSIEDRKVLVYQSNRGITGRVYGFSFL